MPEVALLCHPVAPCAWISAVNARIDWLSDDLIVFYYQIVGDIDRLRLPAQQQSAHAEGLWKSTCFESFIRSPGVNDYLEFNFSPSSEWSVHRFADYRRGMVAVEPSKPPKVICRRRNNELDADIDVHLGALDAPTGDALQVALSVVLEDQNGSCSYWALTHPGDKPDFHHADSFALTLPRPVPPA